MTFTSEEAGRRVDEDEVITISMIYDKIAHSARAKLSYLVVKSLSDSIKAELTNDANRYKVESIVIEGSTYNVIRW